MSPVPEMRAYDRLLQAAAEQMAVVAPRPDLARAAQDAGVSLTQAQAWFADADALSTVVIEQQMVLLTDALMRRASAVPQDDVMAQLRALTHAYLDWFFDNPLGGSLLVSPPAMAAVPDHDVKRFSMAIYDLAQSMMERARAAGLIGSETNIPEVMLTLRALTLGTVALQNLDHARLWGNPGDPRAALTHMMDSYFDLALKKPPEASSSVNPGAV